jgi:hypothetical protein
MSGGFFEFIGGLLMIEDWARLSTARNLLYDFHDSIFEVQGNLEMFQKADTK